MKLDKLGDRIRRASVLASIRLDREVLIARARAERSAGRLRLGRFLLDANAIDAREEGRALDIEQATDRYSRRVASLLDTRNEDTRERVADVFGDLHYFGRSGGSMGDALLEGGGSCEPLSHLIAAALYDSGHGSRVRLRYYGGQGQGETHLAPIWMEGSAEIDLLSAQPAVTRGALFPPDQLIDVYARAHGQGPVSPGASGGDLGSSTSEETDGDDRTTATLADGYPENHDPYPGTTPFYASRAVAKPGESTEPTMAEPSIVAADCAFFVRLSVLDPPTLTALEPKAEVTLHKVPLASQLDRTFEVIAAVERALSSGPLNGIEGKIMGQACLVALYEKASIDFALASKPDLARASAEKKERALSEGDALLAGLDFDAAEGAVVVQRLLREFPGRTWVVLLLRNGDRLLERLVTEPSSDDWGRINAIAALIVASKSRSRGLALAERLTPREQVDVMHEVFRAHDGLRPWASNYGLDGVDSPFVRAYQAFRFVGLGLWEGARPAPEVLDQVEEARKNGLSRAHAVAFIEYYGRNALALHAPRPDARAFAGELRAWLESHGYVDLDVARTAAKTIEDPTQLRVRDLAP